ncbi:MAG: TetR/AcrR family transcriptional regulator [Pseudomonadota bacterium]
MKGSDDSAKPYHHGSLREALIRAAHRQICECGIEKLSIARLCKALGVSSAAPYRHFDDRDELIGEVSARGFRELEMATREAVEAHPAGSVEGLIALGQAYVRFVASHPEMFHVMWGMTREKVHSETAFCAGRDAFQVLLDCVRGIQVEKGLTHLDTRMLALPLWSSVHGLATLHVGERLRVADGVDIEESVALATRTFFDGLEYAAIRDGAKGAAPRGAEAAAAPAPPR